MAIRTLIDGFAKHNYRYDAGDGPCFRPRVPEAWIENLPSLSRPCSVTILVDLQEMCGGCVGDVDV